MGFYWEGNFMKKCCLFAITVLIAIGLISCSPVEKEGLNNWGRADSSLSNTRYLFPDEEFLTLYPYIDGDYRYFDNCNYLNQLDKAFAFIEYDPEQYLEAKQYCLEYFDLSSDNQKEYKGHVFIETLNMANDYKNVENGKNIKYPYHMNLFGYNDSENRLFFIGLYCTESYYKDADLIRTDMGAFLEAFYSEYYDFNAD